MLGAKDHVPVGEVQVLGGLGVAREAEHVLSQGHPRDRAAGLDSPFAIGVPHRLLACREAAARVDVAVGDGKPRVHEGSAVGLITGDAVELDQALDVVEALPAGSWREVKLHAVQAGAHVVARLLEIGLDVTHHGQVTRFRGEAVQPSQGVDDGHVHLVRAGVQHSPAGVEVGIADEIRHLPTGVESRRVTRALMPHQKRQHDVVVPPEVPLAQEALLSRPWPQVPVGILHCEQLADDRGR